MIITFIHKDSKLDYKANMVSPCLKEQLTLMPVNMWLTLHVPGNIFHFKLSLCPLSFKGEKEDERVWEEQLFKTGKHFWLKETLEFVPLYLFPFEFFFNLGIWKRII